MRTWIAIVAMLLVAFLSWTAGAATGYFGSLSALGGDGSAMSYDVEPDATVPLAMRSYRFEPARLEVPTDELVELVVTNEDTTLHTFTYERDGETFDHRVEGGETIHVLVRFDATGEIPFRCKPHDNMQGAILTEA